MQKLLLSCILIVLLAACETETSVTDAFPDRDPFEFQSADSTTLMRYICTRGDDAAERAQSAHEFVDSSFTQFADDYAKRVIESDDINMDNIDLETAAFAETVIQEAEAQFQCLFYDQEQIAATLPPTDPPSDPSQDTP
ncbi:hypothetical protein [Parasulfitobacter algicola]|uniref:Lipoprotein n=1 Tax=Parasulfitobacter algicola TaxID=2614809 RepID=A0ABX2ILR0_9RHOB|nr:hypothetical protein [Sulfitobacter algicola]NSX53794.1 hypothetical protein [Sulfitobacter algicola]